MKSILKYTVLCAAFFVLMGCTKDFDEINTDPDRPSEVPLVNVLSNVEDYIASNLYGNTFNAEIIDFAGAFAQMSVNEYTYYRIRASYDNFYWSYFYGVISNLRYVQQQTSANSTLHAAATVLECHVMQLITDVWGNVPYSESCRLAEGISTPAYDSQEDIYKSLIVRLKEASLAFTDENDDLLPDDLLFHGDIDLWRRYANALRLRMAARVAAKDKALASSVFEEVLGNPDLYPLPESNSHNVFYTAWSTDNPEPWAYNFVGRPSDYCISKLTVDILKSLDDPRLPVYASPSDAFLSGDSDEPYVGGQNGLRVTPNTYFISHIGNRFVHQTDFGGFAPLLRSCEPYFAISYAAALGIPTAGYTQQSAYERAVELSILENEIPADSVATYLAGGGKFDGTLEQLFTQWWLSVFKNGYEAWSLFRMSGYPTGNIVAPGSIYPGHNTPPMAYPYPSSEHDLNGANYAIHAACEVDQLWGKQMWWDVRDTIH
ncbi:MAG: SusD/RagB family nutrient-binding outer membrane lipoprotein [Bacteroidales bacterium]|nr:SusD/RagB family nutrient-binding outer membrane lipoprotein [Candidatus Colimorpha onthohippi]